MDVVGEPTNPGLDCLVVLIDECLESIHDYEDRDVPLVPLLSDFYE